MKSSYITSAQRAEQLPEFPFQEVAFVGRSNVGKSSLLNAVLGRNGLARESNTPGRTQMVNFFAVEEGKDQVILADLPGYGYSAVGKEARKYWASLMETYLERRSIRTFLFLVDVRRASPMALEDLEILGSLARHRAPEGVVIVLTKVDKVSKAELTKTQKSLADVLKKAKIRAAAILPVSTLKKTGLAPLKKAVLGPLL